VHRFDGYMIITFSHQQQKIEKTRETNETNKRKLVYIYGDELSSRKVYKMDGCLPRVDKPSGANE